MKTKTTFLNLFSLVFLFLFLGNTQKALYAQGGTSQPTTSRYMPSTDPNLNPNWDWTVVTPGHTLYYEKDGRVLSTVRQLPLNTLEKDMYP